MPKSVEDVQFGNAQQQPQFILDPGQGPLPEDLRRALERIRTALQAPPLELPHLIVPRDVFTYAPIEHEQPMPADRIAGVLQRIQAAVFPHGAPEEHGQPEQQGRMAEPQNRPPGRPALTRQNAVIENAPAAVDDDETPMNEE